MFLTMLKMQKRSVSQHRNMSVMVALLERKIYQYSLSENPTHSSEPLELIHSDLLKLPTLSYSKYKWIITFLDNYSSFCNITFLYKKSKAVDAIKSIFQICVIR